MATNFYGPVTIGTKVDVEEGGTYIRTKVEAGGVYNEYSSGEEKLEDKEKPVSNEDADRLQDAAAIRVVMAMIDEKDQTPVFKYATQWQAVYRIFVDYRNWTSEYRSFSKQINDIQDWRIPCTEDAIQSIGESYFHKPYKEWNETESRKKSGVFHRVADIAEKLVEFLKIDINKPTK